MKSLLLLPKHKKGLITFISILVFSIFLQSCGPFKYKPVDARKVSPNPDERVRKNIEEGKGFRLMNRKDKSATFASANYLWRATLDTIDFMPLLSANYGGGIIITDWYSENNQNESIKISIRFLSDEIRTDAINIKVFLKQCDQLSNCVVNENKGELSNELLASILRKAAIYEKEGIDKHKKEKPYINTDLKTD